VTWIVTTILPHEYYANDTIRCCNKNLFHFIAAFILFYCTHSDGLRCASRLTGLMAEAMTWNWWSQRIFHRPRYSHATPISICSCFRDALSSASISAEHTHTVPSDSQARYFYECGYSTDQVSDVSVCGAGCHNYLIWVDLVLELLCLSTVNEVSPSVPSDTSEECPPATVLCVTGQKFSELSMDFNRKFGNKTSLVQWAVC